MKNIKNKIWGGWIDPGEYRHNWVIKQLRSLQDGLSILDCGAGDTKYKKYCTHLNYTSQDFCQFEQANAGMDQDLKWDTSRIDIVSDIVDIPVEDNSFDVVLCTEVFEHLKYPGDAVKEFSRIVKPGGVLICTAPFTSPTHQAPYHYYSGFNKFWYREVLKDNGFSIQTMDINGNYFEWLRTEIRRSRQVAKKYSKPLNAFETLVLILASRVLSKASKKEKGSAEFLNFEYMVVAKKQRSN